MWGNAGFRSKNPTFGSNKWSTQSGSTRSGPASSNVVSSSSTYAGADERIRYWNAYILFYEQETVVKQRERGQAAPLSTSKRASLLSNVGMTSAQRRKSLPVKGAIPVPVSPGRSPVSKVLLFPQSPLTPLSPAALAAFAPQTSLSVSNLHIRPAYVLVLRLFHVFLSIFSSFLPLSRHFHIFLSLTFFSMPR